MKLRISKDFMIGVLCGVAGTLYFTAKKFANALEEKDKEPELDGDAEMPDFDENLFSQEFRRV